MFKMCILKFGKKHVQYYFFDLKVAKVNPIAGVTLGIKL